MLSFRPKPFKHVVNFRILKSAPPIKFDQKTPLRIRVNCVGAEQTGEEGREEPAGHQLQRQRVPQKGGPSLHLLFVFLCKILFLIQ